MGSVSTVLNPIFLKKVQGQKHPGRCGIVEHQIPSIKMFKTNTKSHKHPSIRFLSKSKTQLVNQRKEKVAFSPGTAHSHNNNEHTYHLIAIRYIATYKYTQKFWKQTKARDASLCCVIITLFYITLTLQIMHSADSPNELSDLHTTQTQASEVGWCARFNCHRVATSRFAYVTPRRTSNRELKKTSNGRSSQFNQYLPLKPHSCFKPTWFFLKIWCVFFKWYLWQK